MAARVNKIRHDENTRFKIQADRIIDRLQQFIEGKVELSAPQVTAALGLLKKRLPDLGSVELSGEVSIPYVARIPSASETIDEWQDQHVPQPHKLQ